jgi:hypothetical protein
LRSRWRLEERLERERRLSLERDLERDARSRLDGSRASSFPRDMAAHWTRARALETCCEV